MMSARKKQGLPPVRKGTQPRIFIRPHKKKRQVTPPTAPAMRERKSLNDQVLQRPVKQLKDNKNITKQNVALRTQGADLLRGGMFRRAAFLTVAASVAVPAIVAMWYAAGAFWMSALLLVLVAGGGYFYSRLLHDKKRLRKSYEQLMHAAANKSLDTASLQQDLPETLSTDTETKRPQALDGGDFFDDVRRASGTAYAATGTMAMAQRLKPTAEDVDFSLLSGVSDFSDWSDAKILRCVEEAISQNRIDMFIQPIVQLPQRKRRFYEMYSRIRVRPGIYLPAERYIPLAKQDGILSEIDNRLLLHALQLIQAADEGNLNRSFFCNISPFTLNDQRFMADLLEFLTQHRLLAPRLVFELAQEELAVIDSETLRVLDGLSRLGCRFAMDGVGHLDFDFEKMQACHIRYVKVSGGVLIRVLSSAGGFTQVRRIKDAFDYHGIEFIVEKIESERQLVEFLDLQADYGQGYLFGEPRKWIPDKSNRHIT